MERALLQGDAGSVNARAADGKTPLHLAVLMRSRDERGGGDGDDSPILRLLLDAGADTNAQDETGRAALHMCCGDAKNGSALASLLLREGADLELMDKQGNTPFLVAARLAALPLMDLFFQSGSNMSHRDLAGRNALHIAAMGSVDAEARRRANTLFPPVRISKWSRWPLNPQIRKSLPLTI